MSANDMLTGQELANINAAGVRKQYPTAAAAPRPTLFAALAKAQGEIKAAAKDNKNPHFGSKYADLASVWEACRAALAKHGICVIQQPLTDDKRVGCVTILGHEGGDEMRSEPLWTTPKDMSPQSVGSCVTYLRRYQLSAMVGVAPDDDDGNAAQGHTPPKGNGPGATPAGPKPAPEVKTASNDSGAKDIKHNGVMLSSEQLQRIDRLRQECGGKWCTTEDDPRTKWREVLKVYRNKKGDRIERSAELSNEQADHVIARMEGYVAKFTVTQRPAPAETGVIDLTAVRAELARKTADEEEYDYMDRDIAAMFGVDSLKDLTDKQQAASALALVMAYGTDAWDATWERVRAQETVS